MNSFNFAAKGIEREIARQIGIYEAGGTVEQETLHFDPGNEDSPPLRSKEEAQDYRYFPEPDLVPVHPPAELVERLRARSGSCRARGSSGSRKTLSFYDADVLVTGGLDRLWAALVAEGADPKEAANVLANDFAAPRAATRPRRRERVRKADRGARHDPARRLYAGCRAASSGSFAAARLHARDGRHRPVGARPDHRPCHRRERRPGRRRTAAARRVCSASSSAR